MSQCYGQSAKGLRCGRKSPGTERYYCWQHQPNIELAIDGKPYRAHVTMSERDAMVAWLKHWEDTVPGFDKVLQEISMDSLLSRYSPRKRWHTPRLVPISARLASPTPPESLSLRHAAWCFSRVRELDSGFVIAFMMFDHFGWPHEEGDHPEND